LVEFVCLVGENVSRQAALYVRAPAGEARLQR
jgi:hypothetical protein